MGSTNVRRANKSMSGSRLVEYYQSLHTDYTPLHALFTTRHHRNFDQVVDVMVSIAGIEILDVKDSNGKTAFELAAEEDLLAREDVEIMKIDLEQKYGRKTKLQETTRNRLS